MDQSYLGRGEVSVTSIGMPNTAELEARKGNKVIGKTTMSRKFTWGTFFMGFATYYSGWLFCWYYPDSVIIPLNQGYTPAGEYRSPWDVRSDNSVWMKPVQSGK